MNQWCGDGSGMRVFRSILRLGLVAVVAMIALPCFAGEVAILKNGFAIRHERREVVGDVTRLYVTADGSSFVDVPTEQVDHFEAAPDMPAAKTGASCPGFQFSSLPSKCAERQRSRGSCWILRGS